MDVVPCVSTFPADAVRDLQRLQTSLLADHERARRSIDNMYANNQSLYRAINGVIQELGSPDYLANRAKNRTEWIHRRILYGIGDLNTGALPAGRHTLTEVGLPFGSASNPSPTGRGAERRWRMYVICYGGQGVTFTLEFPSAGRNVVFTFALTNGRDNATDDALSNEEYSEASIAALRDANATLVVTSTGASIGVCRVELRVFDVWSP